MLITSGPTRKPLSSPIQDDRPMGYSFVLKPGIRMEIQVPPPSPIEYRNSLSRLILRRAVDEQFLIPLRRRPAIFEAFMKWYERHVLHIDLSNIVIDRPIFLI